MEGVEPCSSNSEIDFDGNVVRNRFMDIWNNDRYADMRYRLLTGNPPDYCKLCKNPSNNDVNNIESFFAEKTLPEAMAYSQTLPATPVAEVSMQEC